MDDFPKISETIESNATLQTVRAFWYLFFSLERHPHSEEEKSRPLTKAPSGIIGLETSLALGITSLVRPGVLTLPQLIEKMTLNPARLYRLNTGFLAEGAAADLVIFDPEQCWTVDTFASKAKNSPFIGEQLYGKVLYTICGGAIVYEA